MFYIWMGLIQKHGTVFWQVVTLSATTRLYADRITQHTHPAPRGPHKPGGFRCKREGLFQPALWPVVSRHSLVGGEVSVDKSEQKGKGGVWTRCRSAWVFEHHKCVSVISFTWPDFSIPLTRDEFHEFKKADLCKSHVACPWRGTSGCMES